LSTPSIPSNTRRRQAARQRATTGAWHPWVC